MGAVRRVRHEGLVSMSDESGAEAMSDAHEMHKTKVDI